MWNNDLTIALHREDGACWSWSFQPAGFSDCDEDEREFIVLGHICVVFDRLPPLNAKEVTGASAMSWGHSESFYYEKEEIEAAVASLKEWAA